MILGCIKHIVEVIHELPLQIICVQLNWELLHKFWNAPSHPQILGNFEVSVPPSNSGVRGAKIDGEQEARL
jgi:hypothetical protein